MKHILTTLLAVTTMSAYATDLATIPFSTITGEKTSLADFKGKVVLLVNTASRCGLTRQYEALEALQQKYGAQDFTIIAFPCNDFANQEPGSNEEIQQFCKTRFNVSFPLMDKIHVKGPDQHPLYTALTGQDGIFPGNVKWNFGKFLIGRDGKAIARFEPNQKPDGKEIVEAVEKALAAKP